jgi:hypothetical protein
MKHFKIIVVEVGVIRLYAIICVRVSFFLQEKEVTRVQYVLETVVLYFHMKPQCTPERSIVYFVICCEILRFHGDECDGKSLLGYGAL